MESDTSLAFCIAADSCGVAPLPSFAFMMRGILHCLRVRVCASFTLKWVWSTLGPFPKNVAIQTCCIFQITLWKHQLHQLLRICLWQPFNKTHYCVKCHRISVLTNFGRGKLIWNRLEKNVIWKATERELCSSDILQSTHRVRETFISQCVQLWLWTSPVDL